MAHHLRSIENYRGFGNLPLKRKFIHLHFSSNSLTTPLIFRAIDNLGAVIDNLEHKTKDILTFLSRPLPSPALSRVDLSAYRDSDLWSDYSRGDSIALSDSISDFGENRSMRSELSLMSGITNNSIQTNNNQTSNQTLPIVQGRRGSGTSSSSERQRANSTNTEISRSSTGVINRLAYNLIGDTRGRSPSGKT